MASKTQFTSFVDDLNAEAVVERNYLNGKPYSSAFYRLYNTRKRLPVFQFKEKFLKMLANHQVLVLTGETGSGKTTQIPQWCVEYSMSCSKNGEDTGRVVCTQPRRMAALSIATRVAQEMDVTLGEEVGYCYRFENCTSSQTVLKYTTDGFLLRECIPDRMLTNYRVVIIDEAHERTVATDALLGVLKQSIQERCDLKIIVMSATMDADKFQRYFGNAPLLSIPGRTYPVEIIYSSPRLNYLDEIISTVIKIHTKEQIAGDILVFLTGQDEIEKAWERIEMEISKLGLAETFCCLPLYGVLPPEEQQRIYEPPPPNCGGFIGRKVILSTNIAEASLTVDGVRFVVDCGFVKQKVYNPHKRMDTLLNVLTSKASAEQRAGRAGRTGPGKCYRMYTFEKYSNMPEYTVPEILRTNLGSVVLQLKKLGITDLENFGFIDPPGKELVKHAEELVTILGAVDANGQLTDAGELMVHFPVDPQMAKILIASWKYRCVDEIFTIVALLSTGQSAFTNPRKYKTEANEARKKFVDPKSDHLTLLNAYNEFLNNGESHDWCRMNYLNYRVLSNAYKHKKDLLTALDKINLQLPPTSAKANRLMITKALASGLFMQVAHLNKGYTYFTVKENLEVVLHPSNCLIKPFPQWVLYTELTLTSKNYIRLVTAVEPDVFLKASPSFFKLASLPRGRARTLLEIQQATGTDSLVEDFDRLDLFL